MRIIGKKLAVLIVGATIILLVAAYYMMPSEKYEEGDKWVYAVTEGDEKNRYTMEVVDVGRNEVVMKETYKKQTQYRVYTYRKGYTRWEKYNKENELLSKDEFKGDPYFTFEFFTPSLKVGKRWGGTFEQRHTDENGTVREHQLTFEGKILGKEKITVEAGEFIAYKVEIRWFEGDTLYIIEEYWYSPEVRYNVKFKFGTEKECKMTAELIRFELKR
ncbi:MAG: hypothetical protein U9N35_07540 [Euryarchaeota archaeon]|nr:hypothetical protein [Euryarchaeota archaeon]